MKRKHIFSFLILVRPPLHVASCVYVTVLVIPREPFLIACSYLVFYCMLDPHFSLSLSLVLFLFRLPPKHAPTFTLVFVGMSRASSQVSPRVLLPLLVLSA